MTSAVSARHFDQPRLSSIFHDGAFTADGVVGRSWYGKPKHIQSEPAGAASGE